MVKKIIIGSAVAGILGYTGAYFLRQRELLKQMCFQLVGIKFLELNFSKVRLNVSLQIVNKSQFDIKIKKTDLQVYVNQNPVAIVQDYTTKVIPVQGATIVNIPVEFVPANVGKAILENITEILNNSSSLIISLKGSATASSSVIFSNTVPVDVQKSVGDILSGAGQTC